MLGLLRTLRCARVCVQTRVPACRWRRSPRSKVVVFVYRGLASTPTHLLASIRRVSPGPPDRAAEGPLLCCCTATAAHGVPPPPSSHAEAALIKRVIASLGHLSSGSWRLVPTTRPPPWLDTNASCHSTTAQHLPPQRAAKSTSLTCAFVCVHVCGVPPCRPGAA
jgi:hypothetical protein